MLRKHDAVSNPQGPLSYTVHLVSFSFVGRSSWAIIVGNTDIEMGNSTTWPIGSFGEPRRRPLELL